MLVVGACSGWVGCWGAVCWGCVCWVVGSVVVSVVVGSGFFAGVSLSSMSLKFLLSSFPRSVIVLLNAFEATASRSLSFTFQLLIPEVIRSIPLIVSLAVDSRSFA